MPVFVTIFVVDILIMFDHNYLYLFTDIVFFGEALPRRFFECVQQVSILLFVLLFSVG